MKDRVKKFYNDHERIILPVTIGVATLAAVAYKINQIMEGKDIERVSCGMHDNGVMHINVILKNGFVDQFHWNNPAE